MEFLEVSAPNYEAAQATKLALAAGPRGMSFGRLTEAAAWLAGCQDCVPAELPRRPRVVVFVGHHGIGKRGVSAFAPAATQEQMAQLEQGLSPAHVLARRVGAGISLVDTPESGPIDTDNALAREGLNAAINLGRDRADAEIDAGADLLIPADLGVGNTTVAAALMGRLTGTEPVSIVGPGSGITDASWKKKVFAIRDAMFRARELTQPLELLETIGGHDAAALVGFMAQAAARRTPMLIDSPLTAVAAVLAERLSRGTAAWIYAGSATPEPSHRLALQDLGLQPLLDNAISTGQGVGSLAALQLITAGVELAADEVSAQRHALASETDPDN